MNKYTKRAIVSGITMVASYIGLLYNASKACEVSFDEEMESEGFRHDLDEEIETMGPEIVKTEK